MQELLEVYKLPERKDKKAKYVAIYSGQAYAVWDVLDFAGYTKEKKISYMKEKATRAPIEMKPKYSFEEDILDCYTGKYSEYLIWNRDQDKFEEQEDDFIQPHAEKKEAIFFQPIVLSTGVCYFCGKNNCYHLKDK